MKLLFTISTYLFSTALLAFIPQGSKVHQGVLWNLPVPEKLTLSMKPQYSFESTCKLLEKQAENITRYNSAQRSLKSYDVTRTTPKYLGFEAVFGLFATVITGPQGRVDLTFYDPKLRGQDDLLLKKSSASNISLIVRNLSEQELKFSLKEDSLSQFSQKHGLEVLPPQIDFNYHTKELVVSTSSMDTACDLLRGRMTLEINIPTELTPTESHIKKLRKFYQDNVFVDIKKIIKNFTKTKTRAAHFGRRTGRIIEREYPHYTADQVDTFLVQMIDTFFTDNMNLKPAFEGGIHRLFVEFDDVTIPLEIKMEDK